MGLMLLKEALISGSLDTTRSCLTLVKRLKIKCKSMIKQMTSINKAQVSDRSQSDLNSSGNQQVEARVVHRQGENSPKALSREEG